MSTWSAFPFLYMVRVVSICLHGHSLCLVDNYCDFKLNVPSASRMDGVWERQIRTILGWGIWVRLEMTLKVRFVTEVLVILTRIF